ncbi:MAG: LLM class flavin-dependent oxidoreductase [Acidobacteriota bacterium]
MRVKEIEFSVAFQTDKPLSAYGPLAERSEQLGFDAVSVYNDLFFQPAWLPLLEMARQTHRVRLGPAAVNPFTCHPASIAGQIALIDEASKGRAYLGLARGSWLDRLGLSPSRPARALQEAIQCVRHLLAGQREPYSGEVFPLASGETLRWKLFRPRIPILLGSWGPKTIRACLPLVEEIKLGGTANPAAVERIRSLIDKSFPKEVVSGVRLVVGAVTVVDQDRERARRLARREAVLYLPVVAGLDPTLGVDSDWTARMEEALRQGDLDSASGLIPDALLDQIALAGSPSEIIDRCLQLVEAGAGRVEFGTPHGLSEEEGLRLLGERVLPALGGLVAPISHPSGARRKKRQNRKIGSPGSQ